MIDEEQRELAEYVKNVHLSLRRKAKEIGAERAWEEHLKNEEVLRKYATSMKELAEKFWSVNIRSQADISLCRIEWVINYTVNYFQKGQIKNEVQKEFKKMKMFHRKGLVDEEELRYYADETDLSERRVKLLDVGSCYNPFRKFDFLEVYPIDLYPADPEVKKCNFLETRVMDLTGEWFHDELTRLPSNYFDIVVFCLFLEYLPSPKQRYLSCVNAYACLKPNGILLIVTPDSKHANANAGLMKGWKNGAAQIGFVRTALEKLRYLYCMAFRKALSRKYPPLLYGINSGETKPEEMFIIPQDSVNYKLEEKSDNRAQVGDERDLKVLFDELPFS